MLYFLAKNPDKQEKLRQEIISVVGPKGSKLTPEALRQLSYIRACTKESLRYEAVTFFIQIHVML